MTPATPLQTALLLWALLSACANPGPPSQTPIGAFTPTSSRLLAKPPTETPLPTSLLATGWPMPTATTSPTQAVSTVQPAVSPTPPTIAPTLVVLSVVLSGHAAGVTELAWSPDGALLATSASGESDFTVRLWSADGRLAHTLRGHTAPVLSLAWSPDGKLLASGSADQTVRLWRPDGAPVRTLRVGRGRVLGLAWSPLGDLLATGSIVGFLDPTVQLWRPDGTLMVTTGTKYSGGKFYNLVWSADGQRLLGGATDYKVWRPDGGEVAYLTGCEHCTPAWGAAWSPDSRMFAIGDENGDLRLYDQEGQLLDSRQSKDDVNRIAWSPDGKLLAAGQDVWQADGGRLTPFGGRVTDLAWSSDGRFLAAAVGQLIDLVRPDGASVAVLAAHTDTVNRLAWSPTGAILASASDDKTVRLWRLPPGP